MPPAVIVTLAIEAIMMTDVLFAQEVVVIGKLAGVVV